MSAVLPLYASLEKLDPWLLEAAGDLGTTRQYMIGNVIESKFLKVGDYPAAAALSFALMAAILVLVSVYVRRVGTEEVL